MLVTLFWAVISCGLLTLCLQWAAEFAEAGDATYRKCFMLSLMWQVIVSNLVYFFTGIGFLNFFISSIINIILCMRVLKIPSENFGMFIIMLTFLNLVLYYGGKLVLNGMLKAI